MSLRPSSAVRALPRALQYRQNAAVTGSVTSSGSGTPPGTKDDVSATVDDAPALVAPPAPLLPRGSLAASTAANRWASGSAVAAGSVLAAEEASASVSSKTRSSAAATSAAAAPRPDDGGGPPPACVCPLIEEPRLPQSRSLPAAQASAVRCCSASMRAAPAPLPAVCVEEGKMGEEGGGNHSRAAHTR